MTSPDVQAVIDKELALLTSEVRRHPVEVDALLDPEFREIGASGRLWTRAAMISALAGENSTDTTGVAVSDMTAVTLAADLVLLTYLTSRGDRQARRSSLWRRTDGRWRLLFHQGTLTGISPPPGQ